MSNGTHQSNNRTFIITIAVRTDASQPARDRNRTIGAIVLKTGARKSLLDRRSLIVVSVMNEPYQILRNCGFCGDNFHMGAGRFGSTPNLADLVRDGPTGTGSGRQGRLLC